jgi:hypothetical protein
MQALIVRMARENSGWGYDRIVGALANLGHTISDQTVGNVLRRHCIARAQRGRAMWWNDFLVAHISVLAGADFFTVEVVKWRGLVTYCVLFFIHLETRQINIAGITRHPDGEWMEQLARSATEETWGYLNRRRYVSTRPEQEVLRIVPVNAGRGRRETHHASAQESESERLRGALGSIGETGMPLEAGTGWRRTVAAQPIGVHGPLPSGTQPSRERQPATDAVR